MLIVRELYPDVRMLLSCSVVALLLISGVVAMDEQEHGVSTAAALGAAVLTTGTFLEWLRSASKLDDEKLRPLSKKLEDEGINSVEDLRQQVDQGYWDAFCSHLGLNFGLRANLRAALTKRAKTQEFEIAAGMAHAPPLIFLMLVACR